MSIYYTNECVMCGKPCIGIACRYYRVKHYECDEHNDEVDKLYMFNGHHICEECLEEHEKKNLYEAYKQDWCDARGINIQDVDEEFGVDGICYVCYEEFLSNEYLDEEYVEYLFENYNVKIERIEVYEEDF